MSRFNKIQVFEQSTLKVGENSFTKKHFELLAEFIEKNHSKYFEIGHNKIRFNQYVGVVQTGNLIIEVLPKIDADSNKAKWHRILLEMLHVAGYIHMETVDKASLKTRQFSLIDLFFNEFIREVGHLVQSGLIKKYRLTEANISKVKGKILISNQLKKNLLNKERIYCAFSEYNTNNLFNQIIKKALLILSSITHHPETIKQTKSMLDLFAAIDSVPVVESSFMRLDYNRKTERYRNSITLAKLIILNYCPDFQAGNNSVLSIMFDMNSLFEKYVYKSLHKASLQYPYLQVKAQVTKRIWQSPSCRKSVRPDIVLTDNRTDDVIVLDTKWKKPKTLSPSDDDLKQMYVYNMYYSSPRSFLLYPTTQEEKIHDGDYTSATFAPHINHSCSLWFLEVVTDTGLQKDIGTKILEKVFKTD